MTNSVVLQIAKDALEKYKYDNESIMEELGNSDGFIRKLTNVAELDLLMRNIEQSETPVLILQQRLQKLEDQCKPCSGTSEGQIARLTELKPYIEDMIRKCSSAQET